MSIVLLHKDGLGPIILSHYGVDLNCFLLLIIEIITKLGEFLFDLIDNQVSLAHHILLVFLELKEPAIAAGSNFICGPTKLNYR